MTDWRDKLRDPACERCALHVDAKFVCLMGSGPKRTEIMIVGEAPGQREDEEHRAFVGSAGKLLDKVLLDRAGIERNDCYVTNVCKCRPPDNRTPELKEIKACTEEFFFQEVAKVSPSFMLLLGNSSLRGVTKKSGITKHAGTIWPMNLGGHDVQVMATLHPAAVLRNPKYGHQFIADMDRFGKLVRGEETGTHTKIKIIHTVAQLRWLIHELEVAEVISWDIETYTEPTKAPYIRSNFQEWHKGASHIVSVAFTWKEGMAAVVPLWHETKVWKDDIAVLMALKKVMERPDAKYVGHNGKFDARWFTHFGIAVPQTFDTMLAAHMLEENRNKGLKPLSMTLLGADGYDIGEEVKVAHTVPLKRLCTYNGKDTDYTYRLYKLFRKQLVEDPRVAKIFKNLMMPASEALVDIERQGVYVDMERWEERHDKAQENVALVYDYINRKWVPDSLRPINLRSNPQLAKWLFGHLGLPIILATKTGAPSTKEEVLLELIEQYDHKALTALLKYRKWAKYLSTYILPWRFQHMDSRGRIHSNYKLFGTVTGRLSGEGGIQQVPRDPFIRSIIGAPKGWTFLQADYSQVELRIAAMIANERAMLRAYTLGQDIHMLRAMRMTGKPAEEVTKEERKKAKAVNFGFIYGMGENKFVKYAFVNYELRVTPDEAHAVREGFFDDFPGLRPWHERQRRLARRYHRVVSPLGRIRHLPDIMSADKDIQAESERQAINSPVQSLASDLMLMALVEMHRELDPRAARIVGTVHDSILFEVRDNMVDEVAGYVKSTMEDLDRVEREYGTQITVPIVADISIGTHWGEDKPWGG